MLVRHCGKNLKPEFEYTLFDYPHKGAKTFAKGTPCPECHYEAFAYQTEYWYGGRIELFPWTQADKQKRESLSQAIRVGTGEIIIKDVRPNSDGSSDKPTRGALHAGDYTLQVARPAEDCIWYHDKIDKAQANDASDLNTLLLCG